jgi:hypothetical protein
MFPVRTKAVLKSPQTLREFRRQLNFAKRRGVRQPFRLCGATAAGALDVFIKLVTASRFCPGATSA